MASGMIRGRRSKGQMIMSMIKRIRENDTALMIIRTILMSAMLVAIFLYLANTDVSTAPEFIYDQF